MFLGPWKHLKFFDEKIMKIPMGKPSQIEKTLKMALFKIQSSVYKLSAQSLYLCKKKSVTFVQMRVTSMLQCKCTRM